MRISCLQSITLFHFTETAVRDAGATHAPSSVNILMRYKLRVTLTSTTRLYTAGLRQGLPVTRGQGVALFEPRTRTVSFAEPNQNVQGQPGDHSFIDDGWSVAIVSISSRDRYALSAGITRYVGSVHNAHLTACESASIYETTERCFRGVHSGTGRCRPPRSIYPSPTAQS